MLKRGDKPETTLIYLTINRGIENLKEDKKPIALLCYFELFQANGKLFVYKERLKIKESGSQKKKCARTISNQKPRN